MADTDVSQKQPSQHELQADGITAAGSIVMAVAGSAPAYSIAATTATLVAVAGLASPAALLWCALPMLGIAWAFAYLGRADVNAGAASLVMGGSAWWPSSSRLESRKRRRSSPA